MGHLTTPVCYSVVHPSWMGSDHEWDPQGAGSMGAGEPSRGDLWWGSAAHFLEMYWMGIMGYHPVICISLIWILYDSTWFYKHIYIYYYYYYYYVYIYILHYIYIIFWIHLRFLIQLLGPSLPPTRKTKAARIIRLCGVLGGSWGYSYEDNHGIILPLSWDRTPRTMMIYVYIYIYTNIHIKSTQNWNCIPK